MSLHKCSGCGVGFSAKLESCPSCGATRAVPRKSFERTTYDEGGPSWRNRGPCGYANCQQTGLIRVHTITGWLNLCPQHIESWYRENADKVIARRTENTQCNEIRAAYAKARGRAQERNAGED